MQPESVNDSWDIYEYFNTACIMKCVLGTLKLYNCYFVLLGEGVLLRLLFVLLVLQYV